MFLEALMRLLISDQTLQGNLPAFTLQFPLSCQSMSVLLDLRGSIFVASGVHVISWRVDPMMFCGMPNSAIAAEACVGLSSMILCFGPAPEVCSAPLLPKRISSASWIIGALLAQHGRQQSLRLPFHQDSTRLRVLGRLLSKL